MILPFLYLHFFCESSAVLVSTPSGAIEGETTWVRGIPVSRFLGIPFVQPPVGELRFKMPVPIEPWNGTLRAKQFGPGCVQYSSEPMPWYDNLPGLSEDCLHLNIWVPADRACRRAVMFLIHIGGFKISSSRIDLHDGSVLAAEGDVILVTTNYRLGAMGFLYSGTEDAPGNMGFMDLIEALKWTRNNIGSFGGDKDSVTLFGQSSGGIAIGALCVSPVARGLFKRAIMQSGTPIVLDGKASEHHFRVSQDLAESVGCARNRTSLRDNPRGVVECLKSINASVLEKRLSDVTAASLRPVYPTHGDGLLPSDPRRAIADRNFAAVDLLIGCTEGDGSIHITPAWREVFGFFGEKDPRINLTFGASIIRQQLKKYPDPEAVVSQYLDGVEEDDFPEIRRRVHTASGDFQRICPSIYTAESFAGAGARVYFYYFVHRPSYTLWAPWMLAVHSDETPFAFGYPLRYPEKYTAEEKRLSKQLIKAWSCFAKTGIPSCGAGWPLFSKEKPFYQILDVNNQGVGCGLHRRNCDFFRNHFGF